MMRTAGGRCTPPPGQAVSSPSRALLEALRAGPPADIRAFVSDVKRLGCDLSAGAIALCARPSSGSVVAELPALEAAFAADLGDGRVYGLLPLGDAELGRPTEPRTLAEGLSSAGTEVALSGPRRDPGALHDALREAELLLELGCAWPRQSPTYRLLVGILLRDPSELEDLRAQTISALESYDARQDTDLLSTLDEFLRHHGSTTETAEAMKLHRHTVGYRLVRVQEVCGLSPYNSDGRERLSLGLKARRILLARQRLIKPG